MNVFFTADTHFGHSFVSKLRFGDRADAADVNDKLIISSWNSVVGVNDSVYHLGDFAWREIANYRRRLNGKIHLILGNHDRLRAEDKKCFESISEIKSIKIEDKRIYMMHYAMRVWNKSHYGSWQLYGHSHGSLPDDPNALSLDVGVDCWNFFPVTLDQIKKKMSLKSWKPIDHHGVDKNIEN